MIDPTKQEGHQLPPTHGQRFPKFQPVFGEGRADKYEKICVQTWARERQLVAQVLSLSSLELLSFAEKAEPQAKGEERLQELLSQMTAYLAHLENCKALTEVAMSRLLQVAQFASYSGKSTRQTEGP